MPKLPQHLGGGPEVSTLAYRVAMAVLTLPGPTNDELCAHLDIDEGDLFAAIAELERAGVYDKGAGDA